MLKTIYLNLDDDLAKITAQLTAEKSTDIVLVFPRKSFLFSDAVNVKLLKKQVELLGKEVAIFTMDPLGKQYATEAGFEVKTLAPKKSSGKMDMKSTPIKKSVPETRKVRIIADDAPTTRMVKKAVPKVSGPARATKPLSRNMAPVVSSASGIKKKEVRSVTVQQNMYADNSLMGDMPVRHRGGWWRILLAVTAAVLIAAVILAVFILPEAEIVIHAKSQPVARDIDFSVTVNPSAEAGNTTLIGEAVSESLETSDTFTSTGKKEVGSKAQGRVKIFNNTGRALNLRASTTTLTVGDKQYYFNEDQNGLVATQPKDDTTNVAEIVAAEGGESFNLPAGTRMEITNQVLGARPQVLFAKTDTALIGGNSRFLSVISETDILKARAALEESILKKYNEKLAASGLTLVDQAYTAEGVVFSPEKPAGTESPSFTAQLSFKLKGLAFKTADLQKAIRDRLKSSLSAGQNLQPESGDVISYQLKNFDGTNGTMTVAVHYESKIRSPLDVDKLISGVLGKDREQAGNLLKLEDGVDSVDITLKPVWQSSIPRFVSKIKSQVKY